MLGIQGSCHRYTTMQNLPVTITQVDGVQSLLYLHNHTRDLRLVVTSDGIAECVSFSSRTNQISEVAQTEPDLGRPILKTSGWLSSSDTQTLCELRSIDYW